VETGISKLKDIRSSSGRTGGVVRSLEEQLESRIKQLESENKCLRMEVDLHRLREEEMKQLQSQLLHAQKMESVGRLAGGVAHDFNNLLTTIIGYVDLTRLTSDTDPDSIIQKNLNIVKSTCEKAASLVRQLLAFSRKQEMEMRPVDLRRLLDDLSKMLQRLIGEDIAFHLDNNCMSQVFADPSQLEQVFMNLAINAKDAMPTGGSLTIETTEIDLDETFTRGHAGTLPGKYIKVRVTDTGEGMSTELQENIFEPFFTTKEIGKGTGLGLATAFGIIEQHKGIIRVHSIPKQGTTFSVFLPVTESDSIDEALKKRKLLVETANYEGSASVMVVDDEKDLCELVGKTLEQIGYQVITANSGQEALAIIDDGDETVDLLVTDMVMPGMNGSELARRLGSTRRMMKVIYMSGYPADVVEEHGIHPNRGDEFMQKPFTPEQLIHKVREVLEG